MISKRTRSTGLLAAVAALCLSVTACQDLLVENLNAPDRERALHEPGDLINFAGSSLHELLGALHSRDSSHPTVNHFMNYPTLMSTTNDTWSLMLEKAEPRGTLDNDPAISVIGPQGPRQLWSNLLTTASIAYDVLSLVDDQGITLEEDGQDITPQVRAYLKLMQGWAWGYLAMHYDQAPILHEDMQIAADVRAQMIELMVPYEEVLDYALDALAEAREIALANTFQYPVYPTSSLWMTTLDPYTNEDIVELANTLSARFLILTARFPEDRRNVDWGRVLDFTAEGVTRDFEPVLEFRNSLLYFWIQTLGTWGDRWDNMLIGRADISGEYQEWIATPTLERTRFLIETPDRRITGPTPDSHGAYTRHRPDTFHQDPVFSHLWSYYQWYRHAIQQHGVNPGPFTTTSHLGDGVAPLVTVDENNLLRAEALIYTGDLEGARDLINITRTRDQRIADGTTHPGLPAVTVDGAPHSDPIADDCVPRNDAGDCGDLMEALVWERMIELAALDSSRGFAESRGFGLHVDGSYVHFPVPGNEADVVGMEWYTFGGVGTEWGAVYSPVNMSNVP